MPDLLILGQEEWDQIERRNQLLVRALATRHPATRFLFVERAQRLRRIGQWAAPRARHLGANIWVMPVIRPVPDSIARRVSDRIEADQIMRGARHVGLQNPWIWTQDPRAADLLDLISHRGLVFDMTDDWVAFEIDAARRALSTRRTRRLVTDADLVLACSTPLLEAAEQLGSEPVLLPNAIDSSALADHEEARGMSHRARPRVGYVGTLHSSRLDVGLLVGAARRRPDWSFLLVGPNLLDPADSARLLKEPNVEHLGVCAHHEVPGYLAGLDVAVIPHAVTAFTSSLNPLKAYQYLAAGLPVLSTAAGVPDDLMSEIAIVNGPEDLILNAEALMAADSPQRRAARRTLVAEHTWDSRAAELDRHLGVAAPSRTPGLVSVVVVSFNTREHLHACLEAVRGDGYPSLQTIVVDNASTDGSAEMVRQSFPDVELVRLEANIGFGPANNVAFGRALGEFVLLLNSDAFLHPGALAEMLAALARNDRAGVIGPRVLNSDGSLQRSAWPFPTPGRLLLEAAGLHRPLRRVGLLEDLGTWAHDQERSVDFLIGACLLIRADALEQVAGFDERFFMYGEETDLQRRLLSRGFTSVLAPRAEVTHLAGASTTSDSARLRLFYGGQFRFLRKNGGRTALLLGRLALLVGSLVRGRRAAAALVLTRVPRP